MAADAGVLAEPAAAVVVEELGDNAVQIAVRPWVNYADYWAFRTSMLESVKVRFDAEGIGFPFPQRDVHVYYAATSTDGERNQPESSGVGPVNGTD